MEMKKLSYKCTFDMHKVCSNSALCHLCDGKRLFKDPVAERKAKEVASRERKIAKSKELLRTKVDKKEGMAFEKRVQKAWNSNVRSGENKPKPKGISRPRIDVTSHEAKRLGDASGSLWFSKGDVTLHHALLECKERGTVNSKGEKQITIPKEWLDKTELEAFQGGKPYWYLPFAYKGSDEIYLVKPFDQEMQLVDELRQAREMIESLQQQLKLGDDRDGFNE
jgi:hypothetical protein